MKLSLNTLLAALAAALMLVIAAGTGVALATKHRPGANLRKEDPRPQAVRGATAFTELGQLRTATAPDDDDARTVIIITPWLEYTDGDEAFYEELHGKLRSVRAIITGYFPAYTRRQLLEQGEQRIKRVLLARINEQLVLGSVSALYFNDYQFLE